MSIYASRLNVEALLGVTTDAAAKFVRCTSRVWLGASLALSNKRQFSTYLRSLRLPAISCFILSTARPGFRDPTSLPSLLGVINHAMYTLQTRRVYSSTCFLIEHWRIKENLTMAENIPKRVSLFYYVLIMTEVTKKCRLCLINPRNQVLQEILKIAN